MDYQLHSICSSNIRHPIYRAVQYWFQVPRPWHLQDHIGYHLNYHWCFPLLLSFLILGCLILLEVTVLVLLTYYWLHPCSILVLRKILMISSVRKRHLAALWWPHPDDFFLPGEIGERRNKWGFFGGGGGDFIIWPGNISSSGTSS